MKSLLTLALFILSQISFAQTLPEEQSTQVLRAVRESLLVKNLHCAHLVGGYGRMPFMASTINWSYFNGAKMAVNENEQPAIVMMNRDRYFEYTALITTDSSFKDVQAIKLLRHEIHLVVRNTGTIIHPNYQEIEERKLVEDVECK